MTCLRFYVLYIILVSSGRRKGDTGKQCAMTSPLQLKRFPSPASVGNRVLDRLIIKPALNPHSATGRIGRHRDRVTANQRDGQITRERDRDREGEMKTVLLTLQQLHCYTFQISYFVPELVSFADIIRKLTSSNLLFLRIV